jgi:hypothetical protein
VGGVDDALHLYACFCILLEIVLFLNVIDCISLIVIDCISLKQAQRHAK